MQFTKDTSKVVVVIYKMFLERKKNGESTSSAKSFKADFYKENKTLSSWHKDDIVNSLSEIKKANFIKMYITGNFEIQDALIIQMENRFKNGIEELTSFLSDLVSNAVATLIL